MGERFGWQIPFIASAVPGLLLALVILFWMKEPERGASETLKATVDRSTVSGLARNGAYVSATLGMAMTVFSLGGISAWVPTFFSRIGGYSVGHAAYVLGVITAVTGLLGTAIGGRAGAAMAEDGSSCMLYLLCAWSAALTVPPALLAFFGPRWMMIPGIAVAEFCIFLGTGPLNAAIVNAVSAPVRATAIAIELFVIHALGDAPSPWIIGKVSDVSNLRVGMAVTLVTMGMIAAVVLDIRREVCTAVEDDVDTQATGVGALRRISMSAGFRLVRDLAGRRRSRWHGCSGPSRC